MPNLKMPTASTGIDNVDTEQVCLVILKICENVKISLGMAKIWLFTPSDLNLVHTDKHYS